MRRLRVGRDGATREVRESVVEVRRNPNYYIYKPARRIKYGLLLGLSIYFL